jgi:phage baseplate assembly protein W
MATVDRNVGFGVLFPLRFIGDDFDTSSGGALFRSRLAKILGVQSADPDGVFTGEYPWRRNFGSQVGRLRHANVGDLFEDIAQVYAVDAITEWEPLAIAGLTETEVVQEGNGQKTLLKVRFSRFSDQTGDAVDPETVETEL